MQADDPKVSNMVMEYQNPMISDYNRGNLGSIDDMFLADNRHHPFILSANMMGEQASDTSILPFLALMLLFFLVYKFLIG